jgi:hypothetical protein
MEHSRIARARFGALTDHNCTMGLLSPTRTWYFAKLLAAIGFVAGGLVVFCIGFRAFLPPPAVPGTALCGNAVFGGLILMVFGTPVAAVTSACVAAVVGGLLDCILGCFKV